MSELVKVSVNFPIEGEAQLRCVEQNDAILRVQHSEITFGLPGTSSPHITIAMGALPRGAIDSLVEIVREAVAALPNRICASFGPTHREKVTGRYVMAEVKLSEEILAWRRDVSGKLANLYSEPARTTDIPHITIAHISNADPATDEVLRTLTPIPDSLLSKVDISVGLGKGAKGEVLRSFSV